MQSACQFSVSHPGDYGSHLLSRVLSSQQHDDLTDFSIRVNDKVIRIHKVILAAASPYFAAMFNSGMKEAIDGEVVLDTIEYDVVSSVVAHIYGQQIEIAADIAGGIFEVCELFQLDTLKRQLSLQMLDNITPENCISLWRLSDKYNVSDLATNTQKVMFGRFKEVIQTLDYVTLSESEILDYLGHEDIESRDDVLEACFVWLNDNIEERATILPDLLRRVQLDNCTFPIVKDIYDKNKDVLTIDVTHMFIKTLLALYTEEQSLSLVILGGMRKYNSTINRECWVKRNNHLSEWESLLTIPTGLQSCQSPVISIPEGIAVLCGGDGKTKNTIYNFKTKIWTDIPTFPLGMSNISALHHNDSIYILGGQFGSLKLDTVYHLGLSCKDKWIPDPKMLEKQIHPITAAWKKNIYVVYNQHNGDQKDITLQCLEIGGIKWEYKCPVPDGQGSTGASMVAHLGKLFLVGGLDRVAANYTIDTNTWTVLKRPKYGSRHRAVLVLNSKIYICGGGLTDGSTDIEEYDPEMNSWKTCSMKLPKALTITTLALMKL